jgi:multiple sugar transport system substrate-binding protein
MYSEMFLRQPRKIARYVLFIALLAVLALPLSGLGAQDNVTITLLLPQFVETIITPEMIADFESQNPGIKVQTIAGGFPAFPSPVTDLDNHFTEVEKYISSADVVLVSSGNLSEEATQAGYFLDLTPLVSTDSSLNPDDFFAPVWQSAQWDGKVWMLPVSADVVTLVYDKEAFDKAGLAYPNGAWTLDDLDQYARSFTEQDAKGNVTKPGLALAGDYTGLLLRSLLGESFYDAGSLPNAPAFNKPALEPLLTTMAKMQQDGVVSSNAGAQLSDIPMRIVGSFGLSSILNGNKVPGSSLLPGGKAGLEAQGFAISAGTQHPDAAYALLKYLSFNAAVANNFFSATPARQSLVGQQVQATNDQQAAISAFTQRTPETQAAIDDALANALPSSELRFGDYLSEVITRMNTQNLDAHTALQDVEAVAVSNQQAAADKHNDLTVTVATPVPEVALSGGEVNLKFGMLSFVTPLPNKDQWDQVINDFVASDPQVGNIDLDTGLNQPADMAKKSDCFYLPLNYVPQLDMTTILNLDPFMDADPSFDRNDVVGGVLAQVQRDNKIWALPIVIQPDGLKYDSDAFNRAGIPAPDNGWDINSFNDALKTLKPTADDKAPFSSTGVGDTYLLLLIAANGGLPLDFRTSPPTINFTDPATIAAIQQVLDLAKDGYIKYTQLAGDSLVTAFGGGGGGELAAIYTQSLSGFAFGPGGGNGASGDNDSYKLTQYPTGSQFNGATYGIGTAYVSATSQNAEACYRWLSTLSRHPELFTGMPARRSFLHDPAVTASQKPDETAFYKQYDALLSNPNTISFPSLLSDGSPQNFLIQRWLDKAFDDYVLKDGDLAGDLATAETYVNAFVECTASIPPYDPATTGQLTYLQQYLTCAGKVDPSTNSLFGGIVGGQGQ